MEGDTVDIVCCLNKYGSHGINDILIVEGTHSVPRMIPTTGIIDVHRPVVIYGTDIQECRIGIADEIPVAVMGKFTVEMRERQGDVIVGKEVVGSALFGIPDMVQTCPLFRYCSIGIPNR